MRNHRRAAKLSLWTNSMNIKQIVFDLNLDQLRQLLDADVITALKGVPEHVLEAFLDLLQDSVLRSGLDVTPATDYDTARLASDGTIVCRIVWKRELVTAALSAVQLHGNFAAAHERTSFQSGLPA